MICKYCKNEIEGKTGWSMSEVAQGDELLESSAMHDECWQQSGNDGGYIERMYDAIEQMKNEGFIK